MKNQITATKNYSQFKTVNSNRPVKQQHVKALMKAIGQKNLLHLNPIIVDAKMNVIDGQHRLEAARQMKLEIFYMVDDNISDGDIAALNTNKSNWSLENYIDFYASKGNSNYKTLKKFLKDNPGLGATTAVILLSGSVNDGGASPKVKGGTFICSSTLEAEEVLQKIDDFKDFDSRYQRTFILALKHCIDSGEYVHETMLAKIERHPDALKLCGTKQQYIELIEKIYNAHSKANLVNFRMTPKQREAFNRKKNDDIQRALRGARKSKVSEQKFLASFLKANKKVKPEPNAGGKIRVHIKPGLDVYVNPGTDLKKTFEKYKSQIIPSLEEEAA